MALARVDVYFYGFCFFVYDLIKWWKPFMKSWMSTLAYGSGIGVVYIHSDGLHYDLKNSILIIISNCI